MQVNLNNLDFWDNANSELLEIKDNKDKKHTWREELDDVDIQFFTALINGIKIIGTNMVIMGKTKRILNTPYDSLLREELFSLIQRRQFVTFVMDNYGSKDAFNKAMATKKEVFVAKERVQKKWFQNEKEKFNLILSNNNITSRKVYIVENRKNSLQVKLLCDVNEIGAKRIIFNYIKLNLKLECMRGVSSDSAVYNAFLEEVSMGFHSDNVVPKIISNRKNVYCYSYIPLSFKVGNTPNWDNFISQIATNDMQRSFMSWVYGIFVDSDFDRRVLWLHGMAQTGKTTVINCISDYLKTFNERLVNTLPEVQDKFSLTGLYDCRLIVYSDANDGFFFNRRDVLTLTGNDIVHYEEKNKNKESIKLYGRIFVTSNYVPVINHKNTFETSRLLYIQIDDELAEKNIKSRKINNNQFKIALFNELPAFLAKCKEVYVRYE